MSLEVIKDELVIAPAAFDPHWHPRAFDALVLQNGEHMDGKSGVHEYARIMLNSGYSGGIAMPNESIRTGRIDGERDGQGYDSEIHPSPISSIEMVLAMEQRIATESAVDMGIFFGLDPVELYQTADSTLDRDVMRWHFGNVRGRVMGLKVYGEETEGGYSIRVDDVADVVEDWQADHIGEPVVLHLEGENVERVLGDLWSRQGGKDWAVHVAHVSSKTELEAIIKAKKRGMNVTCEVTPHHLFMNEQDRSLLGGQGCMKPSLKPQDDVDFLWENLTWIDMFGSDCAPHRPGDKQSTNPSFGITNQPLLIPLLVTEALKPNGRINLERLEDMLCVQPRKRFNLEPDDGSRAVFALDRPRNPQFVEGRAQPAFHESSFLTYYNLRSDEGYERFAVRAFLKHAQAGGSSINIPYATGGMRQEKLQMGFQRILRPLGSTATKQQGS